MQTQKQRAPSFRSVVDKEPYAFYEQLRDGEPGGVRWDDEMQAWLFSKHADCRVVHKNEATFAHQYLDFPGAVEVQGGERGILLLDGPDHTAVHKFLLSFFSMKVVDEYRELYVRPLIRRLLDRLDADSSVDVAARVADPLPAYVIAGLLGVSIDDEETLAQCKEWTEATLLWMASFGEDPVILEAAKKASHGLTGILMPIIRSRKHSDGDDFISRLWQEGPSLLDNWNETDVLAQARVMLNAGSHSTSHLVSNCMYVYLTRPEVREALIGDPTLIGAFVEETIRYVGVIHFHVRTATEDTEVSGCPVAKGQRVHSMLAAANRDAMQFVEPLEFRLNRPNGRSHLGFGFGERLCIGANLARAEAVEVIAEMLRRWPGATLDKSAPPPELRSHFARSYSPLYVRLADAPAL
jgi:cytochrome P450